MNKIQLREFRRAKLQGLIDTRYDGISASLARAADIDPSYISRMLYPEGKAGKKGIGEDMVQKINLIHPGWVKDSRETRIVSEYLAPEYCADICIPQFVGKGGAMGNGLLLDGHAGKIINWRVNEEWANKNIPQNTGKQNLCIVTGFGDSMRGMFNSGDPIIVDTGINEVKHDGVYFFRVGDEGFIKRLQRIPGDGIRVISKNKDYESWTIKPEMDFEVLGRVLKVWKSEEL